jgi:hypothetical protein
VALNVKIMAKLLTFVVLTSIVFFYLEFSEPYLMERRKIEDVLILLGISGGLYMISGSS